MANNAAIKLSVRLSTQRMLTLIATSVGVKCWVALARGSAGVVELIIVLPEVNDESCREICASSRVDVSGLPCCSHVYDCTVKAVTTAENKPVYNHVRK